MLRHSEWRYVERPTRAKPLGGMLSGAQYEGVQRSVTRRHTQKASKGERHTCQVQMMRPGTETKPTFLFTFVRVQQEGNSQ